MTSVLDVANYILKISKEDPEDEEYELISHMKLQKLIYYCQGFSLALFDTPLFPEPIEAWEHGPVCPWLYHELKYCGSAPVSIISPDSESRLTKEEKQLVSDVYWKYGQYAAWKLRKMTHDEIPWKETAGGRVISLPVIKNFFIRNFIMVPPEEIPPPAAAEKDIIQAAIAEAEKTGERELER
jgi:uncharacterized phage-associated protein